MDPDGGWNDQDQVGLLEDNVNGKDSGSRGNYYNLQRENDYLRSKVHSLISELESKDAHVKVHAAHSKTGMIPWSYGQNEADGQRSTPETNTSSGPISRSGNRLRSSSLQGNCRSSPLHRSPGIFHLDSATSPSPSSSQFQTNQDSVQVDNHKFIASAFPHVSNYLDFTSADLNSNLKLTYSTPNSRSASVSASKDNNTPENIYSSSYPDRPVQNHHKSKAEFVHEKLQHLEAEFAKVGRPEPVFLSSGGPPNRRVSWSNRHDMISPVEGDSGDSIGVVGEESVFVHKLETKVHDLERKYELQAAKHRQLTHELTRLRRQASTGELDVDKISAEVQTSPEESITSPDQLHHHSPIRPRYSHSLNKGAGASGFFDLQQASTSDYSSRLRSASPSATASDPLLRDSYTASLSPRGAIPSHAQLIAWLGDHPSARLFRAKYSYVPIRDSPNEHPQLELVLNPGDYLLVEGELDEDLFYEAELFSGERGLVPSNYVERVGDHQIYELHNLPQHSSYRESAPPVPRRASTHRRVFKEFGGRSGANPHPVLPPGLMVMPWSERIIGDECEGSAREIHSPNMPLPESICPYPSVDVSGVTVHEVRQLEGSRGVSSLPSGSASQINFPNLTLCFVEDNNNTVPCPRELLVERQLSKSVVISWSPPEISLMPITQYHVCVDANVKAVVPASYKTKALIEDVQLSFAHRISVRSVTEAGHSSDAACSVTVGKDVCVAPEDVRASQLTPVSVQISWYPANSNCEHVILLNGVKVGVCPPGVFQVQLKALLPSTMYRCAIRAKYPRAVLEEKPVESYVDFKTLPKIGLPDAPNRVQCESGPQDATLLITWTPVTNQPRPPSRAAVAGYLIYADGKKVTEINSPTSDHALLRLSEFADDPPLFITVRTKTREGAVSSDSNVVRVPRHLQLNAPRSSPKREYSIANNKNLITSPGYGGLLMVQPSGQVTAPVHTVPQTAQANVGALPQVAQPTANLYPVSVTLPLVLPNLVTTTAAFQPIHNQLPVYSIPVGAATPGITYTAPPAANVTTTPALATPGVTGIMGAPVPGTANQYYIFHPRLTKNDPMINDKPSLLEMENSYLVKHQLGGPYVPAHVRPPQPRLVQQLPGQPQYFQGSNFNARALPVINPATGIPFRSDQYAQAWQTLSPATRRRLEQYMSQPTVSPLVQVQQDPNIRRQELLQRRAAWKKRSFSADEELERSLPAMPGNYYNEMTGLPQIQITGASGSEGPGSVIDFSEEDWDYSYPNKPSARFRKRYYQSRASSRAHSEPDLRIDPRLGMSGGHRLFVALYDYDPTHMSPNPNAAQDELAFRKGQVLKVMGERDMDGFYRGELNGRWGLVPSNMVQEMDRESAYAFLDQRLAALSIRDPRRAAFASHRGVSIAVPQPHYEHYDSTGFNRPVVVAPPLVAPPLGLQGRLDAGYPQNSSDPSLAAKFANYNEYESSASAERYPNIPGPQHPRVRRMRFGQTKSRSYDYGDVNDPTRATPARRLVDEFGPPYNALRGWGGGSADPDYERDRYRRNPFRDPLQDPTRHFSGPPALRERPRDPYDYRGSLDRRAFQRDSSLPARSPSEQDFLDRRRVPPYESRDNYSRAPYDPSKPRFEVGETRDPDYDRRFARDKDYSRDRRYPEGGDRSYPPYGSSAEDRERRSGDERYPSDRRRGEYATERRELPVSARSAPDEFRSGYQPGSARELPSSARQPSTTTAAPYYPEQPRERERERAGRQGSFRRGGRDGLEQNIREAVRETPAKAMVARFDYDPRQTSPNVDAEQVELTFRGGDLIMVYGEMDDDGFYIGELGGKRGLVPSNFLDPADGQQDVSIAQPQAIPLPPSYDQEMMQEPEPELTQPSRRKADGVTFSDTVLGTNQVKPKPMAPKPAAGPPKAAKKPVGPGGAQLKKMDSTVGTGKPAVKKSSAGTGAPRKSSQGGPGAKPTPTKKKA